MDTMESLGHLRLSELQRRAQACGIPSNQVAAASAADNPRAELVCLILAGGDISASLDWLPPQAEAATAAPPALGRHSPPLQQRQQQQMQQMQQTFVDRVGDGDGASGGSSVPSEHAKRHRGMSSGASSGSAPRSASAATAAAPRNGNKHKLATIKKEHKPRPVGRPAAGGGGDDKAERRYVCTWEGCGYVSSGTGHMKRHMRTHTGERPYVCTWAGCSYSASQSGHLVQHMRSHTGEREHAKSPCLFQSSSAVA